jgi:hypothetical protein
VSSRCCVGVQALRKMFVPEVKSGMVSPGVQ